MGRLSLIRAGDIDVAAGGRLLRAADFERVVEAAQIISMAEAQAARILADARRAREEAAARGYGEGMQQAKTRMAGELMSLAAAAAMNLHSIEDRIVTIVLAAVSGLWDEEPEHERVLRVVRRVSGLLRGEKFIRVRVPTELAPSVRERVKQLTLDAGAPEFIEVVGDAKLGGDDCQVESEAGFIRASREVQLKAIEQGLRRCFSRSPAGANAVEDSCARGA